MRRATESFTSSEGWTWNPPKSLIQDFAPAIRAPKTRTETRTTREAPKIQGEYWRRIR